MNSIISLCLLSPSIIATGVQMKHMKHIKLLGFGTYGRVYLVENEEQQQFALK